MVESGTTAIKKGGKRKKGKEESRTFGKGGAEGRGELGGGRIL